MGVALGLLRLQGREGPDTVPGPRLMVDDITPGRAARLDHARVPKTDLVLSGVGHAHTTVGSGTGWRSPQLSPDTRTMPTPSEASSKDVLSSKSSTRALLVHVRGTLSTGHSL